MVPCVACDAFRIYGHAAWVDENSSELVSTDSLFTLPIVAEICRPGTRDIVVRLNYVHACFEEHTKARSGVHLELAVVVAIAIELKASHGMKCCSGNSEDVDE